MTRIVALLSWYDEDPAWLTRCVESLARLPVSHVVACDGAYALYPNAKRESGCLQEFAIADAARGIGARYSIHIPRRLWAGNEVEKRNHLFAMAEEIASPDDWYVVIDADETITSAPDNVPERLAATPFDVAAVTLREPGHPLGTIIYPTHPKFFRAIPGLRAVGEHFAYRTPDGRRLWGNAKTERLEPRQDLTDIIVEHHSQLRHPDRRQAALDYYRTRDEQGVENLPTERSLIA